MQQNLTGAQIMRKILNRKKKQTDVNEKTDGSPDAIHKADCTERWLWSIRKNLAFRPFRFRDFFCFGRCIEIFRFNHKHDCELFRWWHTNCICVAFYRVVFYSRNCEHGITNVELTSVVANKWRSAGSLLHVFRISNVMEARKRQPNHKIDRMEEQKKHTQPPTKDINKSRIMRRSWQ